MAVTTIPFHQLLSRTDLSRDVAWTPDRTYGWEEFQTRVAGLNQQLREAPPDRWTLVCENSYAFTVGLVAVWQAGDVAVMPPNTEEDMVEGTARETGGIVTDREDLLNLADVAFEPLEYEGDPGVLSELDPDRVTTEMMTSGSTGERKVIPKTLDNFWQDIRHYDDLWEGTVGDSVVFSHVSHQHIFGLFFKVLWPLLEGRPFYPDSALYPGDLASHLEDVPEAYLVTSPSPLKRLVRSGELEAGAGTLRAVYSGGGEIETDVAERIHDELGFYPFSIFGSTECGGIAWRVRDPGKSHPGWNTFPGTEIKINETDELFVRADTVSNNLPDWYPTGDLAEKRSDGTFDLKGRADRVLKIADKRVSLPQIEAKLQESAHVSESIVAVVREPSDGSRKTELGAAVELSETGRNALDAQSRESLRKELRDSLKGFVDDVALPREWIFREKLPRDHMSKISHDTVRELFE